MNKPKLPIIEMFTSIQGEGVWVGSPSIFLRVSGCNLHCSSCDTSYSWNENGKIFTSKEVIRYVKQKYHEGYRHVIISGGEPTLYTDYGGGLLPLVTKINKLFDAYITVETNGSIGAYEIGVCVVGNYRIGMWSISPKLQFMNKEYEHSLVGYFKYVPKGVDMQLKFLVHDYSDMLEVSKFLMKHKMNINSDKIAVILQPLWKKSEDYIKKTVKIVNMLKENMDLFQGWDVRIIPQLHKFLWGNRRLK